MSRYSHVTVAIAAAVVMAGVVAGPVQASWGPKSECEATAEPKNEHCYALAKREITKYGGVLASIDFVDTDYDTYPTVYVPEVAPGRKESFVTMEQWIAFPGAGDKGWIETGQIMGDFGGTAEQRVSIHPFYAEQVYFGTDYNGGKGTFNHEFSEETVPAGGPAFEKSEPYNHYVLFDSEVNGRWHIYWICCEVGYYGGGWPDYLTEQEAGSEAAAESKPTEYGRQEVAASDGGAWGPWSGDTWFANSAMCIEDNEESHAEGNIEFSTCN